MIEDLSSPNGVDRLIHEPARLRIMAILFPIESSDFIFLLRWTGLTKGNLSAHLAKLEGAGYVKIEKTFYGKVPRTTCSLTDEGRAAFRSYRTYLKRTIDSMPE